MKLFQYIPIALVLGLLVLPSLFTWFFGDPIKSSFWDLPIIVTDFANLHALQVVIVADEGVHVAVQALQVVDRRRVELDLDEVFRVCYSKTSRHRAD